MLSATRARYDSERGLELTEDRRTSRSKAHVTREDELTPNSTNSTFYLRDANQATSTQTPKHQTDRRFTTEFYSSVSILFEPSHINMRNEKVRVPTLKNNHID